MTAIGIGQAVDRAITILMYRTTFSLKDVKREVKSLFDRKRQGAVPEFVEQYGEQLSRESFIRVKIKEHPSIGL
jgi:hypothetical protein